MPIVRFVSVSPEGSLRVLVGGRCPSCGSKFIRNTCNKHFCDQVLETIISDKFPGMLSSIKPVSTHDNDFGAIVKQIGGVVRYENPDTTNKHFPLIYSFITDLHPDIDGYIKSLESKVGIYISNDAIVNRKIVMDTYIVCWFIADDTKMYLKDGSLVYGDDILDNEDKFLPGFYLKVLAHDGHSQNCVALDTIDAVSTRRYITVSMMKKKK